MRTFAEKPMASQQATSSRTTVPDRSHAGHGDDVHSILHLQRTIGNYAENRLLQTYAEQRENQQENTTSPHFGYDFSRIPVTRPTAGAIQKKLEINQPGDIYEQEADRVADEVMRLPDPRVQRKCACGGAAGPGGECAACKTKRLGVQRQAVTAGGGESAPPIVHKVLQSPGRPLDAATRAFMEPRFGRDFSQVRVHMDGQAAQSARTVNARAYTVGYHVVFAAGEYKPEHEAGKILLAHELTHVAQQEQTAKLNQPQHNLFRQRDPTLHSESGGERTDSTGSLDAGLGTWVCALLSDNAVVFLVLDYFEDRYPRAHDHLVYYLSGVGDTIDLAVEALFRDNPRAAARVAEIIRQASTRTGTYVGRDPGTAPIRQQDYDSRDWLLALGNIDEVSWEILEEPDGNGHALVRITVRDPYHWSPNDDRNTDCIHEVMERQKYNHAAEFLVVGVGDVRLHISR